MKKLTQKEEIFVREVVAGKTYSDAYRISHDIKEGEYTDGSIWTLSSDLQQRENVRAEIERRQAELMKKTEITIEDVIREMAAWVLFNPKSILTENGAIKPFQDMTDEEAKCISEFSVEEIYSGRGEDRELIGYLKKVKLVDKRSTADMFMKKFGAYVDKKVHEVKDLQHLQDILKTIKE